MRTWMLSLVIAGGAFATIAMPRPAAAVNCDQVRRYLQTGRSVDDVAETMVISVDEVKKCQQSAGGQQEGGQKSTPTPGTKSGS